MKMALVHLSDIHIRSRDAVHVALSENPILQRGTRIAQAVASICHDVQYIAIVVSGDMAFSGKEVEYQECANLLEEFRSKLGESPIGTNPPVLTVAGNHDCDFELSNSVRKIVIDALKADNVDDAVIAQCTEIQRHYFAFATQLASPVSEVARTPLGRLYRQTVLEHNGTKILFHLLNSAWVSQLQEKQGSLYFPVKSIKSLVTGAPDADIAVAVVHHPFNWYWTDNARELRTLLEDNADLILTGHEHVAGAYSKRTETGEQNEYLEGGVLQEQGQADTSSFNVVVFDTVAQAADAPIRVEGRPLCDRG